MQPKQIYGEEELFGGFSGTLQHLFLSPSIPIMKSSHDEASVEKFCLTWPQTEMQVSGFLFVFIHQNWNLNNSQSAQVTQCKK